MLSISTVVPVHYGGPAFLDGLSALSGAVGPPDELIVVADGETDGAWRHARALGARVLMHEAPQGPAYARNRGAETARGDLLFFVDADVRVQPDTLRQIRDVFTQDPGLDALIGSYDDAPGAPNFLSQYRNLLHHYTHQTARTDAATFWGACGAVRREAFLAVGGFDERWPHPAVEDIELGYRLKQAGYRMRLDPTLQVKHLKRWDALPMLYTDLHRRAVPWTRLLWQFRRFDNDLNVGRTGRLSVLALLLGIASLAASFWSAAWLWVSTGAFLFLVGLNVAFYRFLFRKRGLAFTLAALPWHALYYGCSGLGFLMGSMHHIYQRIHPAKIRRTRLDPPAASSIRRR